MASNEVCQLKASHAQFEFDLWRATFVVAQSTPLLGSYVPQCWLASSGTLDHTLRAKILQTEARIDAPLALPMQSEISLTYALVIH